MIRCQGCGHWNPADVSFCGKCGSRVEQSAESVADQSSEELPFAVGTTIAQGRYHLDAVLGQGGMGTVYRATDVSLGRPCALKVLNADLTAHPTARKRMEREARALARIEHPNVVQIRSVFVEGDLLAMELEYMSGGDLRGLIERGGLEPERVVSLMTSILSGLQALHDAKLVHRDIKPENVLLDSRGEPKLTDLGVARDDAESGRTRTRLGAVLGTLEYMSPEQIQGLAVDARSDIYACGVMLVQMLTGELPFAAKSDFEWQLAHVQQEPDLARAQAVHAGLALVAARAMAKSPEERWQDAASMADAIQMPTLPRAVTGAIGDMFDVVLVDGGDNKIGVIKVVRELFSLGLADAKRLVENGGVAKAALSQADADYLRKQLTAAGGAVEIRPVSGRHADPPAILSSREGRCEATPPVPSPSSMTETSNLRGIWLIMLGVVVVVGALLTWSGEWVDQASTVLESSKTSLSSQSTPQASRADWEACAERAGAQADPDSGVAGVEAAIAERCGTPPAVEPTVLTLVKLDINALADKELKTGQDLANSGLWVESIGVFTKFVNDGVGGVPFAPDSDEAYIATYGIANALARAGLLQSAANKLLEVVRAGPEKIFFERAFQQLRELRRSINFRPPELEDLTQFSVVAKDKAFQDSFYYFVGEFLHDFGLSADAIPYLEKVTTKAPDYPRAQYLLGLIAFQDETLSNAERVKRASEGFQNAVVAGEEMKNQGVVDLAYLSLARLAYDFNQFDAAIFYYRKISKNSPKIARAFYESGWSYFLKGDFSRALGLFHAMRCPYFRDQFYPELWILEATIYVQNCHIKHAEAAIERFETDVLVLGPPLRDFLARHTRPEEFYEAIAAAVNTPKGAALPRNLISPVLQNVEFYNIHRTIKQIETEEVKVKAELQRLGPTGQELLSKLGQLRVNCIAEAGVNVQRTLRAVEKDIAVYQDKLTELRFDMQEIELQRKNTKIENIENKSGAISPKWPYEHKFWKDEIGAYQPSLRSECIEDASE